MNAENIKKFAGALKEAFKLLGEQTEQKFKQETLQDGTVVSYDGDAPQLNAPLYVVTPDGQQLPCPDGEVTLPSGLVATVVSGVITELEPAGTPETPATDVETPAPIGGGQGMSESNLTAPQAKAIIESIVRESRFAIEMEEKFAAFKAENDALKAELESVKAESAKHLAFAKELSKAVDQLGDMPSAPVTKKQAEFRTHVPSVESLDEWRNKVNY